jgi:hypothetical protein
VISSKVMSMGNVGSRLYNKKKMVNILYFRDELYGEQREHRQLCLAT